MRKTVIDNSSVITNTSFQEGFACYRNVVVIDSTVGKNSTIGDDTTVVRCDIGNNVAINRRSYINDSSIGSYSYCGINTTINFSSIGKFCSIARNVDIGGFDHDYHKVSTMPMFRLRQLNGGANPIMESESVCEIGNDVWIAAGAQILHKVRIGDGAVIGGGAVVTKDVPPYAIVVGVPAKILKFRFEERIIKELLKIKWWDWPEDVILSNIDLLINSEVNKDTIEKMKEISITID